MESVNRGGLWSISEPSEIIFLKTEQYFRRFTSAPGLTKVDIAGIAQESISDRIDFYYSRYKTPFEIITFD